MKFASIRASLLVSAAAVGAFSATSAYAQSAEDDNGGLAEIIVTAQKREQSVQDVPIAVTAVSQETLQANRIATVNDLSSIAPGVSVRPSAGGIGVPTFTIRGQQSYGVVAGSDKQVSIYLDGVYISSPRGSIFDLPDVARLEVLRGPQGTLFGRNATAGAISVVTREPSGEFKGKLEGSYGNYDAYRLRASIDLPQMGPFSAYFSFLRNSKRGDIRNAAGGTLWDRTLSPQSVLGKITRAADYLGSIDSNSYFAAVKFESGDFKTTYKFDKNVDNGSPDAVSLVGYDPTFRLNDAQGRGTASICANNPACPGAALFAPLFNAIYAGNNLYLNPSAQRPDVVSNAWTVNRRQRIDGHNLTSTWQASDSITVKNTFAYRKTEVFAPSAIDGISSLVFPAGALPAYATFIAFSSIGRHPGINSVADAAGAIPGIIGANQNLVGRQFMLTASQASSISKQWSDELVINYSSDKLNLTVGGLWFKSDDQAGGPEGMQNTFSFGAPFIPSPSSNVVGQLPLGNVGRYLNKATSLAAYAQIEYKLTEQLEVVLGGRITNDKKTSTFRWNTLASSIALPAIGAIPAIPASNVITPRTDIVPPVYKKSKPNFSIGLNYKPNDDTLIYGKWSNSFVSGGSTAGLEFEPETASSFELGLKADLLDRKLRVNLALFHVDYKHFQQPSSFTSPEATNFAVPILSGLYGPTIGALLPGSLSTFVIDTGNVRAKGFELEVTAAPSEGLLMGGSLSYTDVDFTLVPAAFLASQRGEYEPSNRPNWTASAYASYETKPLFGDATLGLRLDGVFRSRYHLTSQPKFQSLFAFNANALSSPPHWKLNTRVALKHINIGGAEAELAFWAKNLTDTKNINSTLFLTQGTAVNFDPARTFGVELGIDF